MVEGRSDLRFKTPIDYQAIAQTMETLFKVYSFEDILHFFAANPHLVDSRAFEHLLQRHIDGTIYLAQQRGVYLSLHTRGRPFTDLKKVICVMSLCICVMYFFQSVGKRSTVPSWSSTRPRY